MLSFATLSLLALAAGTTTPVAPTTGLAAAASVNFSQTDAAVSETTSGSSHEATFISSSERWLDAGPLAGL
jgi:hypothetical protein